MSAHEAAPIGLREFRAYVLDYYATKTRKTYLRARQVLDLLERVGVKSTADLTTQTAARFVALLGPTANANTTRGLLAYVSSFANLAVEERWLERPPNLRRVRPQSTPPARRRDIGAGLVGKLLDHLAADTSWPGRRLYALAGLVALTGLRFNEAARLQLADVDLPGSSVRVKAHGKRLKTGAAANTVPLPAAAVELLETWLPDAGPVWAFPGVKRRGPWVGGAPGARPLDVLQAAARDAGVGWISWHALRHTFASTAVRQYGVQVWAVQRILRHTDSRTTERYLWLDDLPPLRAAVAGIRYQAAV